MTAILTGLKQAQQIPVRVLKIGLAPKPRLINGRGLKSNSLGHEIRMRSIKIRAFEVDNNARTCDHALDQMQGKGGPAVGAFESRVFRWIIDDLRKAELAIEARAPRNIGRWQCDLVQVHGVTR